ncbi:MAG: DNRLRE domain-containing protein [Polyangiaceae bacterium]
MDSEDLSVALSTEDGPSLPAPPPGSTCALIQRGTLGTVGDSDVGYGNGPNWTPGGYPFSWTGPSPYDHWSAFQFDMSVVPAGAQIQLATFSVYTSWNMDPSTIRAHRIKNAWSEANVTWSNFGGAGAWDSAVIGSFNPDGGGFHSIDVTALAQGWHSGQVGNNGILLEEDPVKLHSHFNSEVSTVSRRPSLFVCWGEAPPPACEPVGGSCSANADCCDGVPCTNGTCHIQQCGSAGAVCAANSDCCAGNVCNSGVCGAPAPVCAQPGQACGGNVACCSGICNDGVCPGAGGGIIPAGGDQPGPDQCGANATACGVDSDCCSGTCWDGMCVDMNVCVEPDSVDANGTPIQCDPTAPCCGGNEHCISGSCFNDWVCVTAGNPCNELVDSCCWGMACVNGTCQ